LGPRTGLDDVGKRIFLHFEESNPDFSVVRRLGVTETFRYFDW
jgi:hypothetical protein